MPQSLVKNYVHLIFSTKGRAEFLKPAVRPQVHAYLAGIFKKWDSPAIVIDGHADHVHALFLLSKNHALSKIVEEIKVGSSKWIKQEWRQLADFYWQNGYSAFSVSASSVRRVTAYIQNQEEHHRRRSFQDELRAFLRRHGAEFDERYVWD